MRTLSHLEDFIVSIEESVKQTVYRGKLSSHAFPNLCFSYGRDEVKRLLVPWTMYCFITYRRLENTYSQELIFVLDIRINSGQEHSYPYRLTEGIKQLMVAAKYIAQLTLINPSPRRVTTLS